MKVTKNYNNVGESEESYTLSRHELVKLINVGVRFGRWFDWTRTRHCDKDGFPILHEYDGYEEGVGDEPCLEFLLMKAGLYEPDNIPEVALDEMVDYNRRHEPMDDVTWANIYRHYDKEHDPENYGEDNILDDVRPENFDHSAYGRELTDEEFRDLKRALRKEKEDKE